MAAHTHQCLVCGRGYTYYDAAPTYFCSVGCEINAGPVGSQVRLVATRRSRAGKTVRDALSVESAVPQPAVGKGNE